MFWWGGRDSAVKDIAAVWLAIASIAENAVLTETGRWMGLQYELH